MFVFVIVNLAVLVSSLAGLSIVILSIVNSLRIILINYVVLQKLYGLAVRLNIAMGYLTVFDLYSILAKKGSLKDKLKKWLKVIFDLFWGIG